MIISNGGTLQIAGAISSLGTFDATDGTIEMNGSVTEKPFSGDVFDKKTIKNLIVSNTILQGFPFRMLQNDTEYFGEFDIWEFGQPISTGDNLTLLSNQTTTANVGIVGPGNSIR